MGPTNTRITTARIAAGCVALVVVTAPSLRGAPQLEVTDADLIGAGAHRAVAIRSTGGHLEQLPLEVYVARVLAGEGEPNAPDATQQALAIAIRTFAVFNAGRHQREGFDLCDTTHCQVPRRATPASRRATLATAGRVLTFEGAVAEVFYSASCGGRSETGSAVWPNASYSYLRSIKDDVHEEDSPWTLEMSLTDIQAALTRQGFVGRLRHVQIAARSTSGRAAAIKVSGMQPDRIAGERFRAALGATQLRSTAFSVKKKGETLRFTGRGYGHGVGMCVIGAGRRARRGETAAAILQAYFPRLVVRPLAPGERGRPPAPPASR